MRVLTVWIRKHMFCASDPAKIWVHLSQRRFHTRVYRRVHRAQTLCMFLLLEGVEICLCHTGGTFGFPARYCHAYLRTSRPFCVKISGSCCITPLVGTLVWEGGWFSIHQLWEGGWHVCLAITPSVQGCPRPVQQVTI